MEDTVVEAKNPGESKSAHLVQVVQGQLPPLNGTTSQILLVDGSPIHVDWVTSEAKSKLLVSLLYMLWLDTYSLISDLVSIIIHVYQGCRVHLEWAAEYKMLPIHFLRRLSLEINTSYINVEGNSGDIYLPSMSVILFELNCHKFDKPQMPVTKTPSLEPSCAILSSTTPMPTSVPNPSITLCVSLTRWMNIDNLLLPNKVGLW